MGDRIVVMKDGFVQQIGDPLGLYNHPQNRFVAGFIGSPPMNFLTVKITEEAGRVLADEGGFTIEIPSRVAGPLKSHAGEEVVLGIRPEDLLFSEQEETGGTVKGKIEVVEPLGAEINLHVKTQNHRLIARVPPHHVFKEGDAVRFIPNVEKIIFFDPQTEQTVSP
jgi:multiple sugar transport system ATP-binding protein